MALGSIAKDNPTESWTGPRPTSDSYWAMVVRRFLRHRLAVTGLAVLALVALSALLAPWIAPHDPHAMDVMAFSAPPSGRHLLGTDAVGRDVLSRLLYAARVSLSVGAGAVLLNVLVGIVLGGLAGYLGGRVDSAIMRFTDMVLSFPPLMIILVLVSVLGPSLTNVILVLGLLGWPQICRLVRAEILRLREQEYIVAARALGIPDRRILLRHLVPNSFPPVLVAATFGAAQAIIQEASLSFLGMGVQPPTASWGNMLTDAQSMGVLGSMPWLWLPPGMMIVVAVLSINFVGDGLRDALDPRLN
ncbi:oligopeptide ABC transporter permease [Limnochorda pilosa]|uniref:Peptide ABC transporter permease n=1 Tax=Limnochorda pilosa TaxID=1555112 RepID=A0A0K2SLW0_LIMPI|nr:oligopeptide ABC transporter permease [Limnochorda pilosa]BAS27997.1 peptide ABC transporter permease [Limnochorda pilosa]